MEKITFDKLKTGKNPLCLWCHKSPVTSERWNKKCDSCKKENAEEDPEASFAVGQRPVAAIWEDEKGNQIYVDKFGRPVDNPGYDTRNDPRGWGYTGAKKNRTTIR